MKTLLMLFVFGLVTILAVALYFAWKKYHIRVIIHEFDHAPKIIESVSNSRNKPRRIPGLICYGSATVSWSGWNKEPRRIKFFRDDIYRQSLIKNWRSNGYEKFYNVPDEVKKQLEAEWQRRTFLDKENERKEFDNTFDKDEDS